MAGIDPSKETATSTPAAKAAASTSEADGSITLPRLVSSGDYAVEDQESPRSSTSDIEPTEWEMANLRRVGEGIPPAVFLVTVAEMAERFIYRCMTGPLRMFKACCMANG